jgi:hypothetical protein
MVRPGALIGFNPDGYFFIRLVLHLEQDTTALGRALSGRKYIALPALVSFNDA